MIDAFDIVIFGGTGDLSLRKLLPALYRAHKEKELPEGTRIFSSCRSLDKRDDYLDIVAVALEKYLDANEFADEHWQTFKNLLQPIALDIVKHDQTWQQLHTDLQHYPQRTRLYYLAIPPALFGVCCKHIHDSDLITENSRLVVEKPLGYNASSAEAINAEIATYFAEENIFRIDHYLGKETVQNLLVLRFTNLMFEQLWDAKSIDHVQISISETVGLEGRADFYDDVGALRDMVQNHLLQLLCLITMEPPNKMNAQTVQTEKIKVLQALRPINPEDVDLHTVRGQYIEGQYANEAVPAYLQELNKAHSDTETFVALRAYIDNWRWSGVPFYLRTGKRLKEQCAEIVIQYKQVSHQLYDQAAGSLQPNYLIIRLQPEEKLQLIMMSKKMGSRDVKLQPVTLNLNFSDTYKRFSSDAYKRLILDAAADNSSLFIHRHEVQAAWQWIDPIIAGWQRSKRSPLLYESGTRGPKEADALLASDGRRWFNAGDNSAIET